MPEISKKSLVSSPATGGLELFVIGKNFLKDTRLVFQAARPMTLNRSDTDLISDVYWEEIVVPDKEYLQQVSTEINKNKLITRCELHLNLYAN